LKNKEGVKMLSTEELKEYVCNHIQSKLGTISYNSIFFTEGTDNSIEGTYIFTKDKKYHILFTEKGKIRSDITTDDEREVLWEAVKTVTFMPISHFAACNREKGKDFRRAFFAKEIEIFSLFGEDFAKRKNEEIEEILKKIHLMIFSMYSLYEVSFELLLEK
jgi:hypothetical protein